MKEKAEKKGRHMLRTALLTVLLLVLAGLFWLTVILVRPGPEAEPDSAEAQETPAAARAENAEGLAALIRDFPAPVLAMLPTAPLRLEAAERADTVLEGGMARVLTLTYSLQDGRRLTLTTMDPKGAGQLRDTEGWHIAAAAIPDLNGMPGMAVQKGASLRLLYENGDTLYLIEGAETDLAAMAAAVGFLQLYH